MLFQSIYLTGTTANQDCIAGIHFFSAPDRRRAAVLLIVLVILTIFATLGLAFMFYAESEATSAALFRTSVDFRGPDVEPELACAMFLQQFIFDCRDDASGISSIMRGHSLFRNMYGFNYTINANGTVTLVLPSPPATLAPFNGMGRQHWILGAKGLPGGPLSGNDDYFLPNYFYFPQDGFVRDPERLSVRLPAAKGVENRGPYFGGANPPYTAADMNAMYLASVRADGTILQPSYHRAWAGFGSLDPSNPNWYDQSNRKWRYMVMTPRPADHPSVNGKGGFNAPDDAGGHVRNRPPNWPPTIDGANNDSIWLNVGAPIMTLPDGRKYTFLCAPLIIDLDGKLPINVAGNIRGKNNTSVSSMGFGSWEINPAQLNASDPSATAAAAKAEWASLFVGTNVPSSALLRLLGRYGATKVPSTDGNAAVSPTNGKTPHFYAKIDYDGVTGWTLKLGGVPTAAWAPPGPFQSWPTYPAGFENGSAAELSQHPSLYNAAVQVGDRRIFPAGEMHKILRYGDTNTDAMHCDLWQLLPNNLSDIRKRNMITTLSFDRQEVGMFPWLYNATTPNLYQLTGFVPGGPAVLPKGPPLNMPSASLFGASNSPVPATRNIGKEFGANDWRGNIPPLPQGMVRLDLNRVLPDYSAGMAVAVKARQAFAADIYRVLVKVTGAYDTFGYAQTPTPTPPSQADKDALRYLAQLAVNIVDYIDTDDNITPFNWGVLGSKDFLAASFANAWKLEWVYGTEMPKVTINEAYCQFSNDLVNDPNMKSAVKPTDRFADYYLVDVWAELCNPFRNDATLSDGGNAQLQAITNGNYPIYRLLMTDNSTTTLQYIHAPTNVDGRPDDQLPVVGGNKINPNQAPTGSADPTKITIKGSVTDWTKGNAAGVDPKVIKALNGAFAAPTNQGNNTGFYLVGPRDSTNAVVPFPSTGPGLPAPLPTLSAKGMRYQFPIPKSNPTAAPTPPTLLLQRLLCPTSPPDNNPASPTYNPYITVDYFKDIKVNAAAIQNGNVGTAGNQTPPTVPLRNSVGRAEPYVGQTNLNQVGFAANQPKHTFFAHNSSATTGGIATVTAWPPKAPSNYPAFSWLVHLDRSLVSPMELLHVSGFKPHELTQQFNGKMFGHQAPWFDNNVRLFRFLEFVQTAPRQAGAGTRIAGKINLNTMWDFEVFLALCDPQSSSHFTATDVARIWDRLQILRNSGAGKPGATDQPFLPLSAGVVPVGDPQFPPPQYPNGLGIGNTILRPFNAGDVATSQRLFEPPSLATATTNPQMRYELLNKIYNNVTTRSNCFAVWVTVGFFEVNQVDPASGRVWLGQEIGRAEGRHVRHRMFAIVDRSVMENNSSQNWFTLANNVLNQTIPFNPHSQLFKDLVPHFTVIE
jgi:hypothetical protein